MLHVPIFKHSLLSVGKLALDANIEVLFNSHECLFHYVNHTKILAKGDKLRGLYLFMYPTHPKPPVFYL